MANHRFDRSLLRLDTYLLTIPMYNFVKTLFETSVKLGTEKEIVMQAVQS